MTEDLDVLGLLRKYENLDVLKKQAADEIERLRDEIESMNIAYKQAANTIESLFDDTEKIRRENEILHKAVSADNRANREAYLSGVGSEINSLRTAYKDTLEELDRLRVAGDRLAATGGQHGFDEALDKWRKISDNLRSGYPAVRIVDERPQ